MSIEELSSYHDSPPHPGGVVSLEQAAGFLAERFGSDVEAVVRVGQGEWSTAYAFRHDGADYVIRFGAYPDDFAKDRLAACYRSRDLPIPPITETGEAFDRFYAISDRAIGVDLDALDAVQMRTVLPSLFAALDAARTADLSATGYGRWDVDGIAPIQAGGRRSSMWRTIDQRTGRMAGASACVPRRREMGRSRRR